MTATRLIAQNEATKLDVYALVSYLETLEYLQIKIEPVGYTRVIVTCLWLSFVTSPYTIQPKPYCAMV